MSAEGNVDRLVFKRFFHSASSTGRVFVDVGAARPDYLSISAFYRAQGWRVIAVEPNPGFAALHRAAGHEVYECACGPENRDNVSFSVADSHGQAYADGAVSFESFSSLALKPEYERLKPASVSLSTIRVPMRRLDTILEEAGVDHVDVLSVDVEGWSWKCWRGSISRATSRRC